MKDEKPEVGNAPSPACSSVLAMVLRSQCAQALTHIVERVTFQEKAPDQVAAQARTVLLQKLLHWMSRKGTHVFPGPTIERLRRLAERLARREIRKLLKEHGIMHEPPMLRGLLSLGELIKIWLQLTF